LHYSATPKAKPLCKCTEYTHDQIRAAIKDNKLTTMQRGPLFSGMEKPKMAVTLPPLP